MDLKKFLVPYIQQEARWLDFNSVQADTQSKAKALTKSTKHENVKNKLCIIAQEK